MERRAAEVRGAADELRDRQDGYPPIDDYGVLGDGHAVALVSSDGSIDWLCWPDFDSPSVFAALLDRRRGGAFRIGPAGPAVVAARRYLPGTAVLETVYETEAGRFRLTDAAAIEDTDGLVPQRQLLRRVEVLSGSPEIAVRFAPAPDYGRRPPRLRRRGALGWFCETGRGALVLRSDMALVPEGDGGSVVARVRLGPGESRRFCLAFSGEEPATLTPLEDVDRLIGDTVMFWRSWTGRLVYDGDYRDEVLRSIVTLKLLANAPSGAVIAAGTTSLPEAIGGSLNWDYRYCWLRDASLTLRAFMDLGYVEEGAHFIDWLLHATRLTAPELRPIYDIRGRIDFHERILGHLDGYRGSRPVRIGNAALEQRQLDVYGMVVLAAFDFAERGGVLDREARRALAGHGEVVRRCWREPDEGIWEVRGLARRHTHSALMCGAALDRLIRLSERGIVAVDVEGLTETRGEIRHTIETEGYSERLGAYSGVLGEDALDSSLLVMARTGFVDPDDPRLASTRTRLREALGDGPLLRRYDERFWPVSAPEASFAICSFWEIDYLARRGAIEEARAQFEAMLGRASDLGLLAEEIEPATGAALGNFPQAFSHAGLVNAALIIDRADGGAAR